MTVAAGRAGRTNNSATFEFFANKKPTNLDKYCLKHNPPSVSVVFATFGFWKWQAAVILQNENFSILRCCPLQTNAVYIKIYLLVFYFANIADSVQNAGSDCCGFPGRRQRRELSRRFEPELTWEDKAQFVEITLSLGYRAQHIHLREQMHAPSSKEN